jgi:pyridoxine 5-phosphate synthase
MAKRLGARAVEIQTARYSEARARPDMEREITALEEAAGYARDHGLHLHLGHGLTYSNVRAVTCIPGVEELNIGHSIISRAILVGMERAVREMKQVLQTGNR